MNKYFKGKHGPLLIAEIGGNHEGSFEYARELAIQAIDSNVDVIKFQIYSGSKLVNEKISPERNLHFKKFELSQENHIELAELCIKNKIGYSASIWDESVLDWIDPYLNFYKIGSGDLTAYPLLKKIAVKGKPIILSTGLSSLDEVVETVNYIKSVNSFYEEPNNLAILQCTSLYPNENSDTNLNVIKTFNSTFKNPIGYSDHTKGAAALRIAYSLGAKILEFHFTDTIENKTFRDHFVSLNSSQVKDLILDIEEIQELLGTDSKAPCQKEIDTGHLFSFRRAVYPIKDLEAGTTITEKDITILRPNHGIDARDFYKVIGKHLNKDVKALTPLDWSILS